MRYIIGFLVTIGLVIVVLILLFHGGGTPKTSTSPQTLSQYANNASTDVRWTVDGPINSPQDHRQVQITVNQNQIEADVLKGYNGEVLRNKTYANNPTSYAVLLHALQIDGFAKGNTAADVSDYRGYCAAGDRFIYEVLTSDKSHKQRFWYTTCGQGSYKGNVQLTNDLFKAQVPDYDRLTGDVAL